MRNAHSKVKLPLIGVGLRHVHYREALASVSNIDFVEIHAENFFAEGGITQVLLEDIKDKYRISLHATSMGLGSAHEMPEKHLEKLKSLVNNVKPILLSDHACFSWGQLEDLTVHAGDLLPVPFNEESLTAMAVNVDRVQTAFNQQILVENLSAYITPVGSTMSETEFLSSLCQKSNCKLLLDLNNLMVNATNENVEHPLDFVISWLANIPTNLVGEIHLAGCSPIGELGIMIDDHAQPVSNEVWQLYRYALKRFGAIPTLIEWDLDLPSWDELVEQADRAREIASEVLSHA
ncbi:DUF692 domain-containing protein [Thalassotalea sp. M1531]|uniref:DUF692 domain-containing protein n=1 Tax=Thalassotalea algicola TaxID=2716224 RepID=A0A7Y0Q6E8_9GAMM|nr:DUF692 domain-containing protein [Thalassotalea algicola]NMP31293.1 DUF692 domain-containing protein [Thalassotalea algicola]